MMNNDVKDKLAVCGLDCTRCADYENGEIKILSTRLTGLLRGYERVASLKRVLIFVLNATLIHVTSNLKGKVAKDGLSETIE